MPVLPVPEGARWTVSILSLAEIDVHREAFAGAQLRGDLRTKEIATQFIEAGLRDRFACKPCPFCAGGALAPTPTQGVLLCVDCGSLALRTGSVAVAHTTHSEDRCACGRWKPPMTETCGYCRKVTHGGVQPCPGQTDPCGAWHHCGRD